GARSSYGRPSANSLIDPIVPLALAASNATPARPATASSRPQLGSPPWIAVFTRSEVAIAFAAFRASADEAAPETVTVTSLVAPSPPRTMPSASSRHTAYSAFTNCGYSASPIVAPLAPLAMTTTVSLREGSPSTVMALNVSSTTWVGARFSSGCGTAASVVTNASMVAEGAMSGPIMPDPFAIPPIVTVLPPTTIVAHDSFGKGSVV